MTPSDEKQNLIAEVIWPVWKRKWLVMGFGLLVMATTHVVTKRQTPMYEAIAQIVIDLNAPQYLPGGGREVLSLGLGAGWNTREFLETQYRIIRSRLVGAIVVERLALDKDEDFLKVNQIKDPTKQAQRLQSIDSVGVLLSRIIVEPSMDSRVVRLKVSDHDPARAMRIVNALAKAYADQNVDRKVSAASDAVEWLRQQTENLQNEVKKAEDELLSYKKEHNILNSSLEAKQNIIGMDLQDARKQLRTVRAVVASSASKLKSMERMSVKELRSGVEEVLQNGLVQRLKERIVNLQAKHTELLRRYLPKHPEVKSNQLNIDRAEAALELEVAGIHTSLQSAYSSLLKKEANLEAEVESLEKKALGMQDHELAYKRLTGASEAKKALFQQMLGRLKEAELQAETRANNVRILDEALVPVIPIRPRPVFNLALAFLASIFGGIGLALLIERLDNSVKLQSDLENVGLNFLGVIPTMNKLKGKRGKTEEIRNPDRCVLDHPASAAAECVRTIRTNLLFMATDNELRSMMVTSAGPREGKTCTCVNIAATMALSGSRTLIIDSDLRRPRVHKVFNLRNQRGLTNLVMDANLELSAMVEKSQIPNLDILCSGLLPPNPSEILHTRGFKRTLGRALDEYDRVIFDSPPVGVVTDAQILGQQVDGGILVVSAGTTTRFMLAKAVRLLHGVKVNLLGGLLNNFSVGTEGYGQYYYTYYAQDESDETPSSVAG